MKDLGDARKILGMEIVRDRKKGKVCLSQTSYLQKVLPKFGIDENTKIVSTPLAPHFKLSAAMSRTKKEECDYMNQVPYASAVGSLMYAMVVLDPIFHKLLEWLACMYMHDPGKDHWRVVKWILRYIKGTVNYGLEFCKQDTVD